MGLQARLQVAAPFDPLELEAAFAVGTVVKLFECIEVALDLPELGVSHEEGPRAPLRRACAPRPPRRGAPGASFAPPPGPGVPFSSCASARRSTGPIRRTPW